MSLQHDNMVPPAMTMQSGSPPYCAMLSLIHTMACFTSTMWSGHTAPLPSTLDSLHTVSQVTTCVHGQLQHSAPVVGCDDDPSHGCNEADGQKAVGLLGPQHPAAAVHVQQHRVLATAIKLVPRHYVQLQIHVYFVVWSNVNLRYVLSKHCPHQCRVCGRRGRA